MKLSLNIELFKERTQFLTKDEVCDFLSLLFNMRAGVVVNDESAKNMLGHILFIKFQSLTSRDELGNWSYPDIDTARKVSERNKKNREQAQNMTTRQRHVNDTSTTRQRHVKKAVKKTEPNPLHKPVIDAYHDWYLKRFGAKPSIIAKDTAAVKNISAWLIGNTKEGMQPIDSWNAVLEHWDMLDNFHQGQTSLSQINSNLNNIMSTIKTKANHEQRNREEFSASFQATKDRVVAKYGRGNH